MSFVCATSYFIHNTSTRYGRVGIYLFLLNEQIKERININSKTEISLTLSFLK